MFGRLTYILWLEFAKILTSTTTGHTQLIGWPFTPYLHPVCHNHWPAAKAEHLPSCSILASRHKCHELAWDLQSMLILYPRTLDAQQTSRTRRIRRNHNNEGTRSNEWSSNTKSHPNHQLLWLIRCILFDLLSTAHHAQAECWHTRRTELGHNRSSSNETLGKCSLHSSSKRFLNQERVDLALSPLFSL